MSSGSEKLDGGSSFLMYMVGEYVYPLAVWWLNGLLTCFHMPLLRKHRVVETGSAASKQSCSSVLSPDRMERSDLASIKNVMTFCMLRSRSPVISALSEP